MHELVVLSGKGGTGKTSITGSLATLPKDPVLVDCDVDAANLHLLLNPAIKETFDFYGGIKAKIDQNICTKCGRCVEVCQFDAINNSFVVDEMKCEGCKVCYYECPVNAISVHDNLTGEYYKSETNYGPMIHAEIGIAEGNSGKLVAEVKRVARQVAKNNQLILIDGPPGIACPVISSLSGADYALIVTEPTVSGIHDLERVLTLIRQFEVVPMVCINKVDISDKQADRIVKFCENEKIEIVGKIKYDATFVDSLNQGKPIIEYDKDCESSKEIKQMWERIKKITNSY
ncbi:MAG: ATP-binding protein [Clostridia bacterium]